MSTKLNAVEIAAERYAGNFEHKGEDVTMLVRLVCQDTIREVAQPIADERDEFREAVRITCDQGGSLTSHQLIAFRKLLAKYTKP